MPLISAIINVRNGAATLRDAMDSVFAQSFQDWELIVWDDRSTDKSADIVAGYNDRRVRYFLSPDDACLGKARRDAIRQARGEWIAFLDQDDIWLPGKLEKQLALAEQGVGLIYGRTVRFYRGGFERDYDHAHEYQPLPEGDIFTRLFTESCFIAMSSAMFRRSAIDTVGGIPEAVRIIPDYLLYVAVARQYRARAVQEVICRYRMHPGSMSQTQVLEMHREVLCLIDSWAPQLDSKIVAASRKRHFTAIALEEMKTGSTFRQGFARLCSQGSVSSQLARPFMFVLHLLRRTLSRPYWRRSQSRA